MSRVYLPFAFETITVTSGDNVVRLRPGTFDRPSALPVARAIITVDPGPPISYMVATGTVTSANGHKAAAYGTITLDGDAAIRGFQTTSFSGGTPGSMFVTYYR